MAYMPGITHPISKGAQSWGHLEAHALLLAQCSNHDGPPTPSRPHCSPTRGGTKDKTLAAELSENFGPTVARKSAALLPNSGGHPKFHCDT